MILCYQCPTTSDARLSYKCGATIKQETTVNVFELISSIQAYVDSTSEPKFLIQPTTKLYANTESVEAADEVRVFDSICIFRYTQYDNTRSLILRCLRCKFSMPLISLKFQTAICSRTKNFPPSLDQLSICPQSLYPRKWLSWIACQPTREKTHL